MTWMKSAHPATYELIVIEADRSSVKRLSHGNASPKASTTRSCRLTIPAMPDADRLGNREFHPPFRS